MKLLLVEDDAAMRTTLARTLGRRGMDVTAVGDGRDALQTWALRAPDAVVLDLSLPGMDGLEVLAAARAQGLTTPVLILTARGTVGDRVMGLNTGADDFLPKPFDLDELEARLRALGRRGARGGAPAAGGASDIVVGALRYDRQSGAVYQHGSVLELTPRELVLLHALMAQAGRAVARERLFVTVFPGAGDAQFEAIDVVVYRLRKKLAESGVTLMTLRGLGYLLKESA